MLEVEGRETGCEVFYERRVCFQFLKKVKKKRSVFYMLYSIGTHHNFCQSLPFSDLIGTKHTLGRLCLYIFVDF